jgi:HemY protein
MKLVVTITVTLVIAVGLALVSMEDPGYVVLSRDPYVVRMPMLLFVLGIFLVFVVLYLLFNLIAGLFRAPGKYQKWRTHSNENTAHNNTMQGYAGLIEGNWASAETALLKKLDYNRNPMMNYLGAAYAAQQQGHLARRNRYLDEALAKFPRQHLSINLTRARLHYQAGEVSESRDYLENLRKSAPKSRPVTKLLAYVYQELGDWNSLVELMPALKKLKAFPPEELELREQAAYDSLISSPALLQGEPDRPALTWKSLPASRKKNPIVIGSYVKQLARSGDLKEAETVLRRALNKQYNSELVYLYGKIESPFVEYQIQLAESFTKNHGDDPELILALARLYRYSNDLPKSRELYNRAIKAGARDEVFADMASLLEQMGETDAAIEFYRKSLELLDPVHDQNAVLRPGQGDLVAIEESPASTGTVMPVVR